jgi:hypothetical protein
MKNKHGAAATAHNRSVCASGAKALSALCVIAQNKKWTCSTTYFTEPYRVRVVEKASQNAPHFAVFLRKLFDN